MRAKLEAYNHCLSSVELTCDGKIWPTQSVRRIFNNGCWKQGGRFYGGHWQTISSKDRQAVCINGKSLIELDYKCLHLSMLYNREGYECFDATELYMGRELIVSKGCFPLRQAYSNYRPLIKIAVNILLNAANAPTAIGAIEKELGENGSINRPEELDLNHLVNVIRQAHTPISKWFHEGEGIKCQYIDSQIAEAVLTHFTKKKILVLSVHDSFLVFLEHEEALEAVMQQEYRKWNGGMQIGIERKF